MGKTHIGTPLYEVERGGGEYLGSQKSQIIKMCIKINIKRASLCKLDLHQYIIFHDIGIWFSQNLFDNTVNR